MCLQRKRFYTERLTRNLYNPSGVAINKILNRKHLMFRLLTRISFEPSIPVSAVDPNKAKTDAAFAENQSK